MGKEIDIEKVLYPEKGILKADENGSFSATIVDAEMDGIECKFNYDGCVELNTEGYSHLSLSLYNLLQLIDLIEKAEEKYDEMDD